MLGNSWIQLHVAFPQITLTVYPNYPHKYSRGIDLSKEFTQEQLKALKPENIKLDHEMAALRLWSDRPEELEPYDWHRAGRGAHGRSGHGRCVELPSGVSSHHASRSAI